ncbi:hypothetical protein PRIPAC_71056 [Pristionchus pacificus]|uniref:Uncharacterized protein n=1 Tax=Pristionchus pacificus TaxID=54126 RepID=A0A2A6CZM4_PRIPA|nr:hypothetical protein PRIPAC_71056 [Pristionchus pacificus]|eukprot:PDM83560.1 hypothetical protein PRIPAC_30047 [Pristionchus pacificus]
MVLRPSANLKQSQPSHTSKLSEAAKLEEIKKKIASKISESKEGKRKILQVSVSGLSRKESSSCYGRTFN